MPDQWSGRARQSRRVNRVSRAGGSARSTCQRTADARSRGRCPRARRRARRRASGRGRRRAASSSSVRCRARAHSTWGLAGSPRGAPGAASGRAARQGRRRGRDGGARAHRAAMRARQARPSAFSGAPAAARALARGRGDSGVRRRRPRPAPGARGRTGQQTPPAPWPPAGSSVQGVSGPPDTRIREGGAPRSWPGDQPGPKPCRTRGRRLFSGAFVFKALRGREAGDVLHKGARVHEITL